MRIQLIQGEFTTAEAMELVTQMIHLKVRYHENKIDSDSSEEDSKFRESKIKDLQKELYDLRNGIGGKNKPVKIEAVVNIE